MTRIIFVNIFPLKIIDSLVMIWDMFFINIYLNKMTIQNYNENYNQSMRNNSMVNNLAKVKKIKVRKIKLYNIKIRQNKLLKIIIIVIIKKKKLIFEN